MPPAEGAPPDVRALALEAVFQAIRSGDIGLAKRLAGAALGRGLEHPVLLNLRALEYEDAGQFKKALDDLRRAHFLAPRDFTILNACGLCLARMERFEEALGCFDQALTIKPDFGQAWFNRAGTLERLGEAAKAAEAYARAAELNPENAAAWAALAFQAISRGDRRGAKEFADKALALEPRHPTAIMALAQTELVEPATAEARLRPLLETQLSLRDRMLALGLLADALDAQDRPAEAFAAYAQSNAHLRTESAPRFDASGQSNIPQTLLWLTTWAEDLDPETWRVPPETETAGEMGHVFLLGFPRSGTTLIESALGQHPDIVTLEERNTLTDAVLAFLDDPKDLRRLADAPERRIRELRQAYWNRVRESGAEPRNKIFIDKNPFNTLKLPLILKLFPNAKILFALRDPRDVVLSCFRRRFNINASTYEYLDLVRTAANYAGTMTFADLMRARLGLDEHQLVYERLIEDFAGEARAVCAFIGAEWRDDMINFADRARRGEVASASAAQIARGLYSDGIGQWRRYRDQLAPVLPTLAPWVERFGYPRN